MDEPTNGELKIMLDNLASAISEVKKVGMDTLQQAQKTNGRVSKLEWWRTAMVTLITGIIGAMVFVAPYAIGIIKDEITFAVNNANSSSFANLLTNYNVKVTNP